MVQERAEGPKAPSPGIALGNVGKNKIALKGQKLSISKLLPFQGDFVFTYITQGDAWARSFGTFSPFLNHMQKFS